MLDGADSLVSPSVFSSFGLEINLSVLSDKLRQDPTGRRPGEDGLGKKLILSPHARVPLTRWLNTEVQNFRAREEIDPVLSSHGVPPAWSLGQPPMTQLAWPQGSEGWLGSRATTFRSLSPCAARLLHLPNIIPG